MQDEPVEESVDSLVAGDPGGVAFDDDIDDEDEPGAEGGRGATGVAYDSSRALEGRGIAYPSTTPAGMVQLSRFVLRRWGGANWGILSKPPRPKRGGSSASLHNWGMAWDWHYGDLGRAAAEQVIAFCLEHGPALGIQGIIDYTECRYWMSYRGTWKPGTPSSGTGMGQPWATWLHIERTWAAANDDRPIEDALAAVDASVADVRLESAAPSVGPSAGQTAATEALPRTVLRRGDTGADVARLQGFLREHGFADFTRSDGVFGPRTEAAVIKAQQALHERGWYTMAVDGIWGPASAAAADRLEAAVPIVRLRSGDSGDAVVQLQDFLRAHGFADFTQSDGVFGPRTEAAVVKAQERFAAEGWYTATIDGIWGPASAAAATTFLAGRAS